MSRSETYGFRVGTNSKKIFKHILTLREMYGTTARTVFLHSVTSRVNQTTLFKHRKLHMTKSMQKWCYITGLLTNRFYI